MRGARWTFFSFSVALDIMIARLAFRFKAPESALRMQFHELRYFHRWIKEVEKYEKEH